jgi:hypothetical protein
MWRFMLRLRAVILLFALISRTPVSAREWTRSDPCPLDIQAVIPGPGYFNKTSWTDILCKDSPKPDFCTMRSVHEVLSRCPNITSLDVDVSLHGHSRWPDRWNFPFDRNGGETYPALRRLKVNGYDFSNTKESTLEAYFSTVFPTVFSSENLDDAGDPAQLHDTTESPQPKSNLDLWINAMDWSKIEELGIGDTVGDDVLEKLPPLLKSLRKLQSTDISFIQRLPTNTLTQLSWIGPSEEGDLTKILERQGFSLRHLEFRCNEMDCLPFLTNFNISILPEKAPNLVHLAINIPRNDTWPLESLQTIARLPKLRSLEIFSNFQSRCQHEKPDEEGPEFWSYLRKYGRDHCIGEDRYQVPLLNEDSAEGLFESVQQAKVGEKLHNMTLKLGNWPGPWREEVRQFSFVYPRKMRVVCSESGDAEVANFCQIEDSLGYWPLESMCWGVFDSDWWDDW